MKTPASMQKITMLIEVVPSPRLNVVSEGKKASIRIAETGGSENDALRNETFNDARIDFEVHASSLAFDIAPENILLFDSETIESLRSGTSKTVIVIFSSPETDNVGDDDCDAKQQKTTKIKLTFISNFQKSHFIDNGIGGKNYNRCNSTERNGVSDWFLKKCKKWLYDAVQHGLRSHAR